jgi:undecaprenyl-diphosphatase
MIVIGVASLVMGCLLFLAEKMAKHIRGIDSISGKDGFLVGLGQAMALIPGCSRSGSTLTVAMFLNLKREDAARFSFLLGIPALILSGILELKDMVSAGMNGEQTVNLVVGLVVSTIVSYAAIAWFIKYLRNHSTFVFVAYRIIFGIAVICMSLKTP